MFDDDTSEVSIAELNVNEIVTEVEGIMHNSKKVAELSKIVENMSFSDLQRRTDELLSNFNFTQEEDTIRDINVSAVNKVGPDSTKGSISLMNQPNFNSGQQYDARVSRRIQYGVIEEESKETTSVFRPEDYFLD